MKRKTRSLEIFKGRIGGLENDQAFDLLLAALPRKNSPGQQSRREDEGLPRGSEGLRGPDLHRTRSCRIRYPTRPDGQGQAPMRVQHSRGAPDLLDQRCGRGGCDGHPLHGKLSKWR